MESTSTSPTLLVFTLGAAAESRRRRLLPVAFGNAERDLRRRCLEGALEAGRSCGLRLEVSCPRPLTLPSDTRRVRQQGGSFADRLGSVMEEGLQRSAGPLLLVGADIPGLEARHLRQALERLAAVPKAVVIGPSPDGGLYLLATSRPLGKVLRRVRWCRPDSRQMLLEELRRAGLTPVLLDPLEDLDHRSDLEHFLAGRGQVLLRWRHWSSPLRALLAALRRPLLPLSLRRPTVVPIPVRAGRAPPLPC